jgi:predicted Zn-dependent protease
MKHISSILIVTILLLVISCATTGPGGQKSLIIIPTSQEIEIGLGMAQEVDKTEKRLANESWQQYLNKVGQKIVAICDRKDITYTFTVIESDDINAFAAPGGHIYFYTGLLRVMENEAEMAAVLAHEISHVVARHSIKRIQASMGASLAAKLLLGDKSSEVIQSAVGVGMGLAFASYSRENEREADKFGIYYMKMAGYNPNAEITMFDKLAAAGGSQQSNIFEQLASSHPQTIERINNAKSEIASMGQLPSTLIFGEKTFKEMRNKLPSPSSTKK